MREIGDDKQENRLAGSGDSLWNSFGVTKRRLIFGGGEKCVMQKVGVCESGVLTEERLVATGWIGCPIVGREIQSCAIEEEKFCCVVDKEHEGIPRSNRICLSEVFVPRQQNIRCRLYAGFCNLYISICRLKFQEQMESEEFRIKPCKGKFYWYFLFP